MATIHGFTVLTRNPSILHETGDVVLVDRGEGTYDRYVTGIVSRDEDFPEEWFWGHYFHDLVAATNDFTER